MNQIPISINSNKISKEDKEQLTLLFDNASRTLYNLLVMNYGKAIADTFTIQITEG